MILDQPLNQIETKHDLYTVILDGRAVDRVLGWDTAVARATAVLRGEYGQQAEVIDESTGALAWRWDVAWDELPTAVVTPPLPLPVSPPEFIHESAQFDAAHLNMLALAFSVSLLINVALFGAIYLLLF